MKNFEPVLKHFDEILDFDGNVIFKKKNHKETLGKEFGLVNVNKKDYSEGIQDYIGGISKKHFYLCKSESLKELFDELIKPNCSYVTCYNDIIKKEYKGDYKFPIDYIPVLIKKTTPKGYMKEEFCSKLSNFLGVPTAFYKSFKKNDLYYTLSVDFIKYGYVLESIKLKRINNIAQDVIKCSKNFTKDDKITKDIINQILFRVFIIKDCDYHIHNMAFLKNGDIIEFAPNFDMELSLFESGFNNPNLIYYLSHYHKTITYTFYKKIEYILKNNLLTIDILKNTNLNNTENHIKQDFIDTIIKNMQDFIESFKKYKNRRPNWLEMLP